METTLLHLLQRDLFWLLYWQQLCLSAVCDVEGLRGDVIHVDKSRLEALVFLLYLLG